jgi:hypothetical protein
MPEHRATKGTPVAEDPGEPMGFRILADEGKGQWIEVSARIQGKLMGEASTHLSTYKFTVKPDGTLDGKGQGLAYLKDGSVRAWSATGTRTQKGPGSAQSWKMPAHYRNPTGKFAEFADRPICAEYENDESWKSKARWSDFN